MFVINDNDLPITVAEKIMKGTRPYNSTPFQKAVAKAITGNEEDSNKTDMFDLEEIKEIADYLMVYCNSHENGD